MERPPGPKVIPFESLPNAPKIAPRPVPPPQKPAPPPVHPPAARQTVRRPAPPPDRQPSLDLLPPLTSRRTLKTNVEAVIYCDAPVASVTHRLAAAVIDASMIFIGWGLFTGTFLLRGGHLPTEKTGIFAYIAAMAFIAVFYGFVWVLCGGETAGMRVTQLRLTNFDGFRPEPRERFLRFFGIWISVCTAGMGLLWALVDEENLTWHDHMSKTFPTFREPAGNFVRGR